MKKFEYKTVYVGEKGQATSDFILNGIDETKLNEFGFYIYILLLDREKKREKID